MSAARPTPGAGGPGARRAARVDVAPWSHGLLAVDKPVGVTSHDVVDEVRRRLRVPGAGHLGTLDPGASGLLLVATGAATRCIAVWQGGEKTYEATLRFGLVTSTQDAEGDVLERPPVAFDERALREATAAFVGELQQVPPMVSALKVGGERLYRLARRGVTVDRAPRPVRVVSWEWLSIALPEARFRVRCSGGTYVRTLAHDLGRALGSGAALTALRRLRSEPFGLERAVALRDIIEGPAERTWAAGGLALDAALHHLPAVTLEPDEARELGFGRRPVLPAARAGSAPRGAGPRSVVIGERDGRVLGLGELVAEPDGSEAVRVCPHVLLPWAVRDGRDERGPEAERPEA
ncbi:MAG TPA: tRNA pseudouridine(55) synthase TruB [Candidatus Saccharimonadaceae bacterium]|nr:tRNA pseudouridine(55) synthase TruB [Candidatus Saccharimonadaceae bacterium]